MSQFAVYTVGDEYKAIDINGIRAFTPRSEQDIAILSAIALKEKSSPFSYTYLDVNATTVELAIGAAQAEKFQSNRVDLRELGRPISNSLTWREREQGGPDPSASKSGKSL